MTWDRPHHEVKSTCHECRNEIDLSPYEVFAVTFPNGNHQYHYECLLCGANNIHWLGRSGLADLLSAGVAHIVVTHPPEADEPHTGPVINRWTCEKGDAVINGDPAAFWDELYQVDQDRRTR